MKGANMEGIYLYKERVETIKQMIEELGVSLWHWRLKRGDWKTRKKIFCRGFLAGFRECYRNNAKNK